MMRRAARGLAGLVMVVLAAVGLTACAPDRVAGWMPAQWPVEGHVLDALPASGSGEAAGVGMRVRNDDVGIDARWEYLPGEQPVNAAIEAHVRSLIGMREAASGVGYRPRVFAAGAGLDQRGCDTEHTQRTGTEILGERSGTVVVCEITLARGSVFAETLRAVTGAGGVIENDTATTIYTDLSTGAVGTGADLFADPAPLWSAMIEVLRRDAGSLSIRPVAAPDEEQLVMLRTAVAAATLVGGEVILPVPTALRAAELDGLSAWSGRAPDRSTFVAIDADAVAGALSPLGRAVADAVGPFTGPESAGAAYDRTPCDLVPCMAMTLDDGPSTLTPGFLDVLQQQQSAATFFMLGQNAQRHPDIVRRVAAEGHEIGNHTWNHPYLTELSDASIRAQLNGTRDLLQQLSGQAVGTFRPPGGFVDDRVLAVAAEPAIMWSVDTRDWAGPDDATLRSYAIDTPQVGTIMLMHDIQAVSSRVFGDIVAGLRDRGFSLVTVEHLFGGSIPGGLVRHGPVP